MDVLELLLRYTEKLITEIGAGEYFDPLVSYLPEIDMRYDVSLLPFPFSDKLASE